MSAPVYAEYFADPFVLQLSDGSYVAYGTGRPPATGDAVFEALTSTDLTYWQSRGRVLPRLPAAFGDEYWAPEVLEADGEWWMYYSVGHGIEGHHLRVARAEHPLGPFVDQGVNLTPSESFAIDAHPFRDLDGTWYLFFARDVLHHSRPGTHLAVLRLSAMDAAEGAPVSILEPNADWQIFERDRHIYNGTFDWHTLEGPTVVYRAGRYWMTYSGGAWTGEGYAVSWAVADHPTGPWAHAPQGTAPLLKTNDSALIGPGHNSLTVSPDGDDVIVFHAWDAHHDARKMHVHRISFQPEGPWVDGPTQDPSISASTAGMTH
ncbi:GH43 family beta-xylosidase [Microbacterium endophyticum]|uniref:GH43 family beta-xylosidase n=1 Tax=Microbacterium endophyticum TaxID=1526412 RepID=A0A7W4V3Y3_9MICO|nr:glycoside hydrolase family 43 protein [Microbacterium endophyticum]MBB2976407.1 GH43 family beta-xylosidase [Microbacterium endophyticum]NIK35853.1 GH43 family beta-xylosidase [Microbacterium endophyticum]